MKKLIAIISLLILPAASAGTLAEDYAAAKVFIDASEDAESLRADVTGKFNLIDLDRLQTNFLSSTVTETYKKVSNKDVDSDQKVDISLYSTDLSKKKISGKLSDDNDNYSWFNPFERNSDLLETPTIFVKDVDHIAKKENISREKAQILFNMNMVENYVMGRTYKEASLRIQDLIQEDVKRLTTENDINSVGDLNQFQTATYFCVFNNVKAHQIKKALKKQHSLSKNEFSLPSLIDETEHCLAKYPDLFGQTGQWFLRKMINIAKDDEIQNLDQFISEIETKDKLRMAMAFEENGKEDWIRNQSEREVYSSSRFGLLNIGITSTGDYADFVDDRIYGVSKR